MTKSKKIIVSGVAIITIFGVIVVWYVIPSVSRGCSLFVGGSGSPTSLYFSEVLQNGFIEKKGGRPIEGFQPFMFMEVYTGLGASDFNCVEEHDGGVYVFKDGQLTLPPKNTTRVSSAEGAITPKGMNQLLQNIATRFSRPFPLTNAEVDYLISLIAVYLNNTERQDTNTQVSGDQQEVKAISNQQVPVLTLDQKLAACGSIPNGSTLTIRDTSRMFINLPKDVYPDRDNNLKFSTIRGSTTSGYISNGGPFGLADEATPTCWSYRNEFDSEGEIVLTVHSAMRGMPDYFVRFIVVPAN